METSSDRIRALRGKTSRKDLSRATGIPTTSLQTLEERPQEGSRHYPALAAYFGVRVEWLQTGKGPKSLTDVNAVSPDPDGQLANSALNVNEISARSSRNLRTDPVMLRAGFDLVENQILSLQGVFKVPDDLDLLAAGYDYLRSYDRDLLAWIGKEIQSRLAHRGVAKDDSGERTVDNKTKKRGRSR